MVDKMKILSNFDIDNNILDCSTDENLSDFSLSDTSSENGDFEECNNGATKSSESEQKNLKENDVVDKEPSDNTEELCLLNTPENDISKEKIDSIYDDEINIPSPDVDENKNEIEKSQQADKLQSLEDVKDEDAKKYEDSISINFSEDDFRNDEFSRLEQTLNSNYVNYLNSPKSVDLEPKDVFSVLKPPKPEVVETYSNCAVKSPDDKRFQNLQEEINLLNILMYEAENQTEKCGSLYNSFTNEINNNLAYSKAGVVEDCAGSLASLVDGSKFDVISVKSEMLFSDYGKSESNYDISESQHRQKAVDEKRFVDEDAKSIASLNQAMSVDSNLSDDKTCRDCDEETVQNREGDKKKEDSSNLPVDERVVVLWNQIIRLKCSLKNLQLNLKEQQMETLMQINEFLINQNINIKDMNHSHIKRYDRKVNEPNKKLHENLSDTSLIFTENNRVKENIALNNLKIALIECNLLSSTASSLVNSIPKYESSELNSLKSKISSTNSSRTCCCDQIEKNLVCLCPSQNDSDFRCRSSLEMIKCVKENNRNKRLTFIDNSDETIADRKVKSNEEIGTKYHETKYCMSEVRLDPISPRACI